MRISVKDHLAQQETRTFVDVQTQAVARFNHVVHDHFRVAMLSIKHFKEKREIVGACRANPKSSTVVISSLRATRRSFSLNACSPRNSMMLARLARFSCSFTTARRAFCCSSGRTTSTALCAATSKARTTVPSEKRIPYRMSAKTNQIFQLPSKIAPNSDVTSEHKLVGDLEPYGCLLLTSTRIDRSQIQIHFIENRVAISCFAFLGDLAVELLHQQRGRPSGKNVSSREFPSRRPGSDQRDDFFLRQRRFTGENRLW